MTMMCILCVLVVNEHNYFYKNVTKDEPLNFFFELVLYMLWTTLIHICFHLKQIQICDDEFLTGIQRE